MTGGAYANCNVVFERLAHFQSFNMKLTCMQEVVDPLTAIVICLKCI